MIAGEKEELRSDQEFLDPKIPYSLISSLFPITFTFFRFFFFGKKQRPLHDTASQLNYFGI